MQRKALMLYWRKRSLWSKWKGGFPLANYGRNPEICDCNMFIVYFISTNLSLVLDQLQNSCKLWNINLCVTLFGYKNTMIWYIFVHEKFVPWWSMSHMFDAWLLSTHLRFRKIFYFFDWACLCVAFEFVIIFYLCTMLQCPI